MTTIPIYIDINTSTWNLFNLRFVTVSGPEQIKCKNGKTGFKYVTHNISTWRSVKLRFFIPISNKTGHKEIKICQNAQDNVRCTPVTIKTKTGVKKVYVYFYEEDPRPLMLCYDGKAYRPKNKDKYFSEWVKVEGIEKCFCDEKGENEPLLKSLTRVVGFLNRVDLSKHPTASSNGCISGTTSGGEGSTCPATENNNANTCTYDVHTYQNKPVQVKVTCSPVNRNGTDGTTGNCNYKKLTHTPAGFNGTDSSKVGAESGFRLGNVVYNNGSKSLGRIPYYPENGSKDNGGNKSDYWWNPLLKVTAYYYDQDKEYKDPLLVELEFNNGEGENNCKDGDGAGTVCEYYMLIITSGSGMVWSIDREACKKLVEDPSNLVEHLDVIRYGLKKVLKVEIAKKSGYGIQLSENPGAGSKEFEPLPLQNGARDGGAVVGCEEVECPKLAGTNYKCYQHQIQESLGDIHNEVAGVAFTIPSDRGDGNPIEIKLFNGTTETNCQNGTRIQKLTYNSCMGDVYVFFYIKNGVTDDTDTVPLMLWYAGNYYAPCNRDEYFSKWVQVSGLTGEPCKSGEGTELVGELEKVNRALNQIDLDKSILAGTGTVGYGLPDKGTDSSGKKVMVNTGAFKTERVMLTRQIGPKEADTQAYYRVVHRTVNGFTIGDIKSDEGKNELTTDGFCVKGSGGVTATIQVKQNRDRTNGNQDHKELAAGKKWNTVVAYYSKSDSKYQLPQLILILKTNGVSDPVTSVKGTGYGYYILSAKNGASGFEYVWHEVTKGQNVTLNDATDFRLLNSVVILIEQRPNNGGEASINYNEAEIKEAITSAGLSSPGLSKGEINRITRKNISVTDETAGTCLSKTGFKLITHDISQLVTVTESLQGKLSGVKLIAGLRFLIPTREGKGYKELPLHDGGKRVIYHHNNQNKIYVYFYGSDPRPLMLCYNNCGYAPKDMSTYFKEWVKETNVTHCKCVCAGDGSDCDKCDELLKALVEVSDFLNPVMINRITETSKIIETIKTDKPGKLYRIHTFNGVKIKIKLQEQKSDGTFCYNRHTHAPEKPGFRLGNIVYNKKCIEEIKGEGPRNGTCITSQLNNSHPYTAASEVVVYYYKEDKDYKNPLLVALKTISGTYQPYYELQKSDGKDTEPKRYTKCDKSIELDDKAGGELEKILDKILFQISKRLQIIIDQLPKPKLYCPSKPDKNDKYEHPFKCEERPNGKLSTPGKTGSPSTDLIPSSYEAQLYKSDGSPLQNGTGTPTPTNASTKTVKVTLLDSWQLTTYGYKCYEHQITTLPGVEEIGGLKFYLWDNTGGKGKGDTNCGTTTGASCPNAGSTSDKCRELCLYKPSSEASAPGTNSCTVAVPKASEGSSCPATAANPVQPAAQTSNCTNPAKSSCTPDKSLQLVTTTYTTCKGNVYVFFYGDDPRPLMLCYDGNVYGPRCLALRMV